MDYSKIFTLEPINYFCEFDKIWKIEEWRDIPNYEGIYKISDLGRIKSLSRIILKKRKYPSISKEKILKLGKDNRGYSNIVLCFNSKRKTRKVHQLVAIAFLNHTVCGSILVINHKNFIKTDNKKLNLEIVTSRENSNRQHIKSASKYTGVSWCNKTKKWRARIGIKFYRKHLGLFINEIDAYNAYQKALLEIT